MLHTKFGGNQSTGSGEDFKRFLLYVDMAAMLKTITTTTDAGAWEYYKLTL